MFLLNSCLSLFSAACFQAPLLPKLRGHFAEFLNNASPVGLGILSPSTCVGFRYGRFMNNSGFSRYMVHMLRYSFSLRITLSVFCTAVFPWGCPLPCSCLACTGFSIPGSCLPYTSPQFCHIPVQESPPALHRLRISASP